MSTQDTLKEKIGKTISVLKTYLGGGLVYQKS
jgi:hypothetical protein